MFLFAAPKTDPNPYGDFEFDIRVCERAYLADVRNTDVTPPGSATSEMHVGAVATIKPTRSIFGPLIEKLTSGRVSPEAQITEITGTASVRTSYPTSELARPAQLAAVVDALGRHITINRTMCPALEACRGKSGQTMAEAELDYYEEQLLQPSPAEADDSTGILERLAVRAGLGSLIGYKD